MIICLLQNGQTKSTGWPPRLTCDRESYSCKSERLSFCGCLAMASGVNGSESGRKERVYLNARKEESRDKLLHFWRGMVYPDELIGEESL